MVPPEVELYILERGLDVRFRREFGLETLAECVVSRLSPHNEPGPGLHTKGCGEAAQGDSLPWAGALGVDPLGKRCVPGDDTIKGL